MNFTGLICKFPRFLGGWHRRRRRLKPTDPPHTAENQPWHEGQARFQCPRCKNVVLRKIKAKKVAA